MFKVFAGSRHYPDGGYDDFRGSFETEAEAHECIKKLPCKLGEIEWAHVVLHDEIASRWEPDDIFCGKWTRKYVLGS